MSTPSARARRSPGEVGIWVFVIGDMIVFAVFFAVIVVLAAEQPDLVRESQARLSVTSGALNTILLLTSSVLVALAVRAAREPGAAHHLRARKLFGFALACGLGFAVIKAAEYGTKIDAGLVPATNDFFAYFYVFTAIHLLHVTAGIGVLVWLMRLSGRPALTAKDRMLIESGASYWHMVDLLWVVLFPLLYLVN
ncbi:Cytochrome bo(3) ubiquinol oxidase subunit 3 [Paraconexibacter sp. AEG42_29]|uniref:Cytochrome aa3 subunit 3 n=1 Tax=Paraconexibacter sp. AEG42_29 TaxID=2997339 RepID=A0AAU7B1F9_9ACTN